MDFPIEAVRAHFPALNAREIFLDAPGGTQICQPAIDAMVAHLTGGTANAGGAFRTSRETDAVSAAAHHAMAELLGAQAEEIAFGANMTSLAFAASRALSQAWAAGDEIVLSRLDHDANVAPWLLAARDRGVTVKWIDFDPAAGVLELDGLAALLGPRTRLVAVGGASNALGTLNDVGAIVAAVRAGSDALVFVDAVQSVPHVPTDVAAIGCDLLVCSPYKFFGPHQGVLWARPGVLDGVGAYKVRPAADTPPARRLETGTPSFEGQAGVIGTIDYLAWLGGEIAPSANSRPGRLKAALEGCIAYERALGERLLDGLASVPGLTLYGPPTMDGRVPTFGFTLDGKSPQAVAARLGEQGIFAWAGHFYAVEAIGRLGLAETGGLVRLGLCHYHRMDEVDRTVAALRAL